MTLTLTIVITLIVKIKIIIVSGKHDITNAAITPMEVSITYWGVQSHHTTATIIVIIIIIIIVFFIVFELFSDYPHHHYCCIKIVNLIVFPLSSSSSNSVPSLSLSFSLYPTPRIALSVGWSVGPWQNFSKISAHNILATKRATGDPLVSKRPDF